MSVNEVKGSGYDCVICQDSINQPNAKKVTVNCGSSHGCHLDCFKRAMLSSEAGLQNVNKFKCISCTRDITHYTIENERPTKIEFESVDALPRAVEKGNVNAIRAILNSGKMIRDISYDVALNQAAREGKDQFVELLAASHEYSVNELSLNLANAAAHEGENYTRIIDMLFNKIGEEAIDAEERGRILINAAASGRLNLIEFVCEKGELSRESLVRALANAAAHEGENYTRIIDVLFNKIGEEPIDAEGRGRILLHAVLSGRLDLVKLMHEKGVPQDRLGHALIGAAINGKTEVVRYLLANNPALSDQERSDGYMNAMIAGNFDLAEEIRQNGPVYRCHKSIGNVAWGVRKTGVHKVLGAAFGAAKVGLNGVRNLGRMARENPLMFSALVQLAVVPLAGLAVLGGAAIAEYAFNL